MIHFTKQDKTIYCNVNSGLSSEPTVSFSFLCSSQMCAELLLDRLQERLNSQVKQVRMEEYNAGWKDKTRHLAKCQYFFSSLNLKKQ